MAYKIVGHRIDAKPSPSAEDLKRKFETAVCEIHQADRAAKTRMQHRLPIAPRRKLLGISQVHAEKLAVLEAAQALAALWKV